MRRVDWETSKHAKSSFTLIVFVIKWIKFVAPKPARSPSKIMRVHEVLDPMYYIKKKKHTMHAWYYYDYIAVATV